MLAFSVKERTSSVLFPVFGNLYIYIFFLGDLSICWKSLNLAAVDVLCDTYTFTLVNCFLVLILESFSFDVCSMK